MITLARLHPHDYWFPDPATALDDPNGLLAVGGDLQPRRLLAAYRRGIFPWYQDDQPLLWWCPDPRTVLFPNEIHISRSLRKTLNANYFQVTMDRDFAAVIRACGAYTPRRRGTWITAAMSESYTRLHEMGCAHSVEVWRGPDLVGGLYGVNLGSVFFGESMFSRATDASKVALVHLCGQLQQWGFAVIDCQVRSDHLCSLGAREVPRSEFQRLLEQHVDRRFALSSRPWQLDWQWTAIER